MVLQCREHDLVAFANDAPPVRLRDEVDRLGRAPDEDDLLRLARSEQRGDLAPGALVRVGGPRRQRVRAAVDVGVVVLVEVAERVDHRLRLLGGRCVVEPDQTLAVDLLLERGKVTAETTVVVGDTRPARRELDVGRRSRLEEVQRARRRAPAPWTARQARPRDGPTTLQGRWTRGLSEAREGEKQRSAAGARGRSSCDATAQSPPPAAPSPVAPSGG